MKLARFSEEPTTMKRSILLRLTPCFAVAAAVVTAGISLANGGEYIVNSQVTSDTAAAPGTVSDSYVGDISAAEAGIAGGSSGCMERQYGQPDLFYNYYTQGYCNLANAQMYLSPVPVPPNVGHTFYTYQPLYPHHYLYWHKDRYHNYYDGGRGTNRTKVHYYSPPVHQALSNFYWNKIRLPR